MLQAMLAGVASIKAQQTRMSVIGDNLANVNTTAFKGSRVTFQDLMSQTLKGASSPTAGLGGTDPQQVGLGVKIGSTDVNNQQGSLNATNRPLDMAIQGNGFFTVTDGTTTSYTRDGAFGLDAAGNIVHSGTGLKLVGWRADALGGIDTSSAPTQTLNIPLGSLTSVQATTRASLTGNLNGDAAATDAVTAKVRVYDATGGAHDVTVKFTNRTSPVTGGPAGADSSWGWEAFEGDVSLGSSATAGNSPMYFDASGKSIAPAALNGITIGGAAVQLDFGTVTGMKAPSGVSLESQNGYAAGTLESFSIGGNGVVTGIFSNGFTRPLGQIATAEFTNPEGMERTGNNLWRPTNNSGTANVGTPGSGGRGGLASGYLEQSNVDLSQEFTDLIITQRGFQANTKIVSTVDEMLQELMQLKR